MTSHLNPDIITEYQRLTATYGDEDPRVVPKASRARVSIQQMHDVIREAHSQFGALDSRDMNPPELPQTRPNTH